jgi:hypothetical protein
MVHNCCKGKWKILGSEFNGGRMREEKILAEEHTRKNEEAIELFEIRK